MRDRNIATYTYLVDMQGRLHHVCDSMGYGLPYGVQYSNPEKHLAYGSNDPYHTDYSLPQVRLMAYSCHLMQRNLGNLRIY